MNPLQEGLNIDMCLWTLNKKINMKDLNDAYSGNWPMKINENQKFEHSFWGGGTLHYPNPTYKGDAPLSVSIRNFPIFGKTKLSKKGACALFVALILDIKLIYFGGKKICTVI